MAFDDDLFAGAEAGFDGDVAVNPGAEDDGAEFDGLLVGEDVDVVAGLAVLERGGGDDDGVLQRFKEDGDVDELAGPEAGVGVGESGFKADGAGGSVDGVV